MKTLIGRISDIERIEPTAPDLPPVAVLSIVDNDGRMRVAYSGATGLLDALELLFGSHPQGHAVRLGLDGHAVVRLEAWDGRP
jgi:hypothetical protein